MPATKDFQQFGKPSLTWRELKSWINSNAHELHGFAKAGFSEKGRGLVILAGSPRNTRPEMAIQCRYIMPEEIVDIENEALDLAHELVERYDPYTEFVVVTIDARSQVTSALVSLDHPLSELIH